MPEALEEYDEDGAPTLTKKDSLQDSEMTPATDTGSISEESTNTGGWFGIGSDVKAFARSIKDNTPPAISGVASFIHRSALTVAAEIASLEREAQLETERWREENYGKACEDDAVLHLPWEVPHHSNKLRTSSCETIYEEDEELMQKILELSHHEETFLGQADNDDEEESEGEEGEEDVSFSLDEPRINLIRRLLEIDDNLAAMHAKLSGTNAFGHDYGNVVVLSFLPHPLDVCAIIYFIGRSDVKETAFWRNYFSQCERVRTAHLEQKFQAVDVNSLDSASGTSLGSLVPADGSDRQDDSSYEYVRNSIASPPSSANTVHTDLSVGDMVLVRAELNDLDKSG